MILPTLLANREEEKEAERRRYDWQTDRKAEAIPALRISQAPMRSASPPRPLAVTEAHGDREWEGARR